jgi:hypothetical protein
MGADSASITGRGEARMRISFLSPSLRWRGTQQAEGRLFLTAFIPGET